MNPTCRLTGVDLALVAELARMGETGLVRQCLADVTAFRDPGFFDGSPQRFAGQVGEVRKLIQDDADTDRLFGLFIVAIALLENGPRVHPVIRCLPECLPVNDLLRPLTWNQALGGSWRAVPVLFTSDYAWCRYFIAGQVQTGNSALWPAWAEAVMDPDCQNAVATAASLAKTHNSRADFFVFPLTVPTDTVQFTGGSLGLALALGFLQAGSQVRPKPALTACGGVDRDGRVMAVEQIEAKIRCAEENHFHALLLPAGNHGDGHSTAIELLPVENVAEARTLAQLYEPGRGRDLLRLADMLGDPDAFVRQADVLEPRWIDWSRRQGKLTHVLDRVFDDQQRVNLLIDKFDACLKRWDLAAARAIADLAPVEQVEAIGAKWPVAALKLCTLNLALANHGGDVATAGRWAAAAQVHVNEALKADLDACAAYFNNHFVSLQNRFAFDPDLTVDVKMLVAVLERRHKVLAKAGCRVDRPLGELCGTLAQHFGFCGPAHIETCLYWIAKGKKAFGGGTVAEMQPELDRLQGYVVYALLDAGLTEKARSALRAFVGRRCRRWTSTATEHLTCWQHAALARLLAEISQPADCRYYLDGADKTADVFGAATHPKQLWNWNLGRMALKMGESDLAKGFFHQSLNLCLNPDAGPTIVAMALLPLSGLMACGETDSEKTADVWNRALVAAGSLNPTHFDPLLQQPMEKALADLWARPQTFFPFSYR